MRNDCATLQRYCNYFETLHACWEIHVHWKVSKVHLRSNYFPKITEVYLGSYQISMMKVFEKIDALTILQKRVCHRCFIGSKKCSWQFNILRMSRHKILRTKLHVETQENETELRGLYLKKVFYFLFIPLS